MFSLRPATETDQEAIKALIKEAGINPLSLKWSRFIIAMNKDGNFIGWGQVKPYRDGSMELASIAVKREFRRQGVARALITELQQIYGRPLWLTCISQLVPFYEPFGFVEITDLKAMPPFFKRAKRFFKLYIALTRKNLKLAVMVWQ